MVTHLGDVAQGPIRRRHIIGNGCILCGQAKSIPTHGLQHVLALHSLIACDHISNGVVADVAHMQLAAGVREHGEAIKLFSTVIAGGSVSAVGCPLGLGGKLNLLGTVFLNHRGSENSVCVKGTLGVLSAQAELGNEHSNAACSTGSARIVSVVGVAAETLAALKR